MLAEPAFKKAKQPIGDQGQKDGADAADVDHFGFVDAKPGYDQLPQTMLAPIREASVAQLMMYTVVIRMPDMMKGRDSGS